MSVHVITGSNLVFDFDSAPAHLTRVEVANANLQGLVQMSVGCHEVTAGRNPHVVNFRLNLEVTAQGK